VPIRALNAAAVEMGVADYSDLTSKEIGSGEDAFTIPQTLPDEQYNEAIDRFESTFGVTPSRQKLTVESDFINPEITTENSLEKFGELFLDDDPDRGDDPEFEVPRVSSNVCWQAYLKWCEINNIEAKNQQDIRGMIQNLDAEKSRVQVIVDTEKKSRAAFLGVHLHDDGWWLWRQTRDED
jgi:hypothetical protein